MSKLTKKEENEINEMINNGFQNVTENNVGNVVTLLDKLSPEDAKAIIDKMPDAIRGMEKIVELNSSLVNKGIESSEKGLDKSCSAHDKNREAAIDLSKNSESFEEQKYWFNEAKNEAQRIDDKDSEHRQMVGAYIACGTAIVTGVLAIIAGAFIGFGSNSSKD